MCSHFMETFIVVIRYRKTLSALFIEILCLLGHLSVTGRVSAGGLESGDRPKVNRRQIPGQPLTDASL